MDRVELESETYNYKKTIVLVLFFYKNKKFHKNELSLEGAMNNEYRYTICFFSIRLSVFIDLY